MDVYVVVLSEMEQDALAELANIGVNRAAVGLRQILGDGSRSHISRAARGEWHDDANRPAGPFLRLSGRRNDGGRSQQRSGDAQSQHWKMILRFVLLILSVLLPPG